MWTSVDQTIVLERDAHVVQGISQRGDVIHAVDACAHGQQPVVQPLTRVRLCVSLHTHSLRARTPRSFGTLVHEYAASVRAVLQSTVQIDTRQA